MNLPLKLSPNKNYFTEELVGNLLTEFKLFKVKFALRFAFILSCFHLVWWEGSKKQARFFGF